MTQSEDIPVAEKETDGSSEVQSKSLISAADKQFDELCEQYYHAWFRYHPETAVDVGVHDYADQLKSYDHDEMGALLALNQKMLSALDELNSLSWLLVGSSIFVSSKAQLPLSCMIWKKTTGVIATRLNMCRSTRFISC